VDELLKAFDALGSGGTVVVPLHDAIWGAKFGILTDAFGVRWVFDCDNSKAEADKQ
jgi:PhnB protein